jgi:hypothetical protein
MGKLNISGGINSVAGIDSIRFRVDANNETGELQFTEVTENGANYVGFKAPSRF